MNIFIDPLLFLQFLRDITGGIFDSFFVRCSIFGEATTVIFIISLIGGIVFPFIRASRQMKTYLQVVDPEFAPYVKLFATFNPVDGAFNMRIKKDSDEELFLECVSEGKIIDEMRAERYIQEHAIDTYTRLDDGSNGEVLTYWKYDSPDKPMFLLTIHGGWNLDYTTDDQLEADLKSRIIHHYEQLQDEVADKLFRCNIHYQMDNVSYRIKVDIEDNSDFKSLVDETVMTKEEFKR